MELDDERATNLANWEQRVPLHVASQSYGVQRFIDDPSRISEVVAIDRDRLGDLRGLDAVHLQCHIGTDTVSLARLGARVTGFDFSPTALEAARDLARRSGTPAQFVRGEMDHALAVLGAERFDLVYTGVGALCWLPSMQRWAATVAGLLRPGGRLFLREGHPVLWSIDEKDGGDDLVVRFPAFGWAGALRWEDPGTYVDGDVSELTEHVTYSWNHSLSEVIGSLLDAGMRIESFEEHLDLHWEALPGKMVPGPHPDTWVLADRPERIPLSYTLSAVKDRELSR
ncbi:MAG: class I SAM-dependent methyltransferase [Acidimicrobiia bacterium]